MFAEEMETEGPRLCHESLLKATLYPQLSVHQTAPSRTGGKPAKLSEQNGSTDSIKPARHLLERRLGEAVVCDAQASGAAFLAPNSALAG